MLRDLLMAKFGREFAINCMENKDNFVSKRVSLPSSVVLHFMTVYLPQVTSKLSIATIPVEHVDLYLHEIGT